MRLTILLLFISLVTACTQSGNKTDSGDTISSDSLSYAEGIRMLQYEGYKVVEVVDPWNKERLLQQYILVPRGKEVPEGLPQGTVIRVPLQKVVVYTSVHASIIDQLGEVNRIVGVCEPQYMDTPSIQEGLAAGRIADLGEATAPNIERIIDIGAEVIIASPFQNMDYGTAGKLGIPVIEAADYMETFPLGRAEWIRFFGLLFGREQLADELFRETETSYLSLKELVANVEKRPTVFAEKRYGSFWYISAGESYTAHFFRDAGADYVFASVPGAGSEPMAFETVLDEAINADFWLMKYNLAGELSYRDLRTEYTPYENFDAFKNHRIFTCNTGKVPYYEEFPLHPDYLLKDLIRIFHPELLPDYKLRYYQPMEIR
ncbi:MAG: ABC transporter substrate-binding protein [Tannerellaceae bacterium]|nr:ABC transporter substrate-binding protein [Tannerellaceae bacterium]